MIRSIYYANRLCNVYRPTVKVHDESADNPLFVNFYWISAEKKIPELTLVGCHLPAKPSGIF